MTPEDKRAQFTGPTTSHLLGLSCVHVHSDHAVLACNALFRRVVETIESIGHRDIPEPDLREERDQLCLRQSPGDSTGPQVDVAPDGFRQFAGDHDVGIEELTTGSQDAEHL